jgi:hypothetical protein
MKNAREKLQTTSYCSLSTSYWFVSINSIYCDDFLGASNYNPLISWRKAQTHSFFFHFLHILRPKYLCLRKTKGNFEVTSELEVQSAV